MTSTKGRRPASAFFDLVRGIGGMAQNNKTGARMHRFLSSYLSEDGGRPWNRTRRESPRGSRRRPLPQRSERSSGPFGTRSEPMLKTTKPAHACTGSCHHTCRKMVGDPGIEPGVSRLEGVTVPCHTLRPVAHCGGDYLRPIGASTAKWGLSPRHFTVQRLWAIAVRKSKVDDR